jgi:hypothetical protein
MPLSEVLTALHDRGVQVSEPAIRWAIKTRKVSRPQKDGSGRFDFSGQNLKELVDHFSAPAAAEKYTTTRT